jgi:aspartate/methionine/tyrosine aminotransferase
MLQISRRTAQLGTENAFVVLGEVEELMRRGEDIVSYCIGQPDFVSPKNICEAGIRAIREGHTGYTPSNGIRPLREAVARQLGADRGLDINPDDVVIGAGGKPFIGYTIASVTDAGQGHEVIFPNPGYPIYESQIRVLGAVPVPLPIKESRAFAFDPDDLASRVNRNTRLVMLNTPQNPTGGILTREDLEKIADILRPHEDIWIYTDEIYSRLVYDEPFASIASQPGMAHRTVIADGASKTWAMTGWRIGYAVNRTLAPHFTRWVTNTESCPGHMNQYAALEAITGPQDETDRMRDTFHERRDLIVKLLNELPGVSCLKPGGAFYVWPNITEACAMIGAEDSEEFRKLLLNEAKVAVLSDIHFGPRVEGEGQHIRLSYATATDSIRKGLDRIGEYIKKKKR